MLTLNTLRTRFGVVLSIVIVLALLAFIISLGPEMGFFGSRDPKVGEINGDNITYSEYLKEYETIKKFNGGDESSERAVEALSTAAWQSLVAKHVLVPGFEKMGIAVSKAEREIEKEVVRAGEDAAREVGVVGIPREILHLLGELKFRTSYGQNVLLHSIEMAHMAGMIAEETAYFLS